MLGQRHLLLVLGDLDIPFELLAYRLLQGRCARRLAMDDVSQPRRLLESFKPAQNLALIGVSGKAVEHLDLGAHRNHFA